MTAFIARNATESITFLRNDADAALTEWSVKLAKEYLPDLAVKTSELPKGAGSDYMSWDRAGYRESRRCRLRLAEADKLQARGQGG